MEREDFPDLKMWGFDSFRGLPVETADVQNSDFAPGSYSSSLSVQTVKAKVGGQVDFVVGFYNETLTATLANERAMAPAFLVDIDADLYTSSFQALDWMFAQGLVRPGTLVGYDDWCDCGPTHCVL